MPASTTLNPYLQEIDVSGVASPLRVLNWATLGLFLVGLEGSLGVLTSLPHTILSDPSGALPLLVMLLFFCYLMWIGWNFAPGVYAIYERRAIIAIVIATVVFSIFALFFIVSLKSTDNQSTVLGAAGYSCYAVMGFIAIAVLLHFRRFRLYQMDMYLRDVFRSSFLLSSKKIARLPAQRRNRGIAYLVAGLAWLVAMDFLPTELLPANVQAQIGKISIFGFLFLAYARQCFQPSFDSIMAADHRPPVLFLRSFADDGKMETVGAANSLGDSLLLDFSLESRLAKHFSTVGPFIAVGSPLEAAKGKFVPHLGAARATVSDVDWQSAVLGWIDSAAIVLCMAGTTHWFGWELTQVVQTGNTHKLVLIFPDKVKVSFKKKRQADLAARWQNVLLAFQGTPWQSTLQDLSSSVEELRCLVFGPNGQVITFTSKQRSRDSHHVATLLAHATLLEWQGLGPLSHPSARTPSPIPGFQLAGLFRRAMAVSLDAFLVYSLLPLAVLVSIGFREGLSSEQHGFAITIFACALYGTPLLLLYHTLCEAFGGSTIGKYIFRIQVRKQTGRPSTFGAAFLRNLIRPIDLFGFYLIACISEFFSQFQQRLGDRTASTVVVHRATSRLPRTLLITLTIAIFVADIVALIQYPAVFGL